jgi:ABC-type multidrug transport system ATPase subunit
MAGYRQFTSLLRKNVLVKSRQPFSTCFELALPLVLFGVLAYVRRVYQLRTFGPYYFGSELIEPLGYRIFGFDTTYSQGAEDILGMQAPFTVVDGKTNDDGGVQVQQEDDDDMNATSGFQTTDVICSEMVINTMGTWLTRVLSTPSPSGNLGLSFLVTDADAFSKNLKNWMDFAKDMGSNKKFQQSAELLRQAYFKSVLPGMGREASKVAQQELDYLTYAITARNGSASAQSRVEGWFDDVCNADSDSLLLGANRSQFSQDVQKIVYILNATGLLPLLNSTFSQGPLEYVGEALLGILLIVGKMQASPLSYAKSADAAALWVAEFARSGSFLARLLGETKQDASWWNFGGEFTQTTTSTTSVGITTEVAQGLLAFLRQPSVKQAVGSATSLIKQLQQSQDSSQRLLQGSPYIQQATNAASQILGGNLSQILGNALGNSTNASRNILQTLLSGSALSSVINQTDMATALAPDLAKWLNNLTNLSIPTLEDLLLGNATSLGCSPVTARAAGMLMARTNARCPFYRNVVPDLAGVNFTDQLLDFEAGLNAADFAAYQEAITRFANTLPSNTTETASQFRSAMFNAQVKSIQLVMAGATPGRVPLPSPQQVSWAILNSFQTAVCLPQDDSELSSKSSKSSNKRRRASETSASPRRAAAFDLSKGFLGQRILIAPFKGEVKQLLHLFIVEATLTMFEDTSKGDREPILSGFLGAASRCPLIRAMSAQTFQKFLWDRFVTFETEAALEAHVRKNPDSALLGIVFKTADPKTGNFPPGPLKADYAIRANAYILPSTQRIISLGGSAMYGAARISSYAYVNSGFAMLQETLGRAAARFEALRQASLKPATTKTGGIIYAGSATEEGRRLRAQLEQFPGPRYVRDGFIRIIQNTLPLFMILGWIYAVSLLVREVVYEKQERLRDVMRIMGLKTWVYWASWMASAMIQMTILTIFIMIFVSGGKVIKYSDKSVIFVFLWLYSIATVSLSMLISAFFSRAKVAAAVAGLAYWVLYMPYPLYNQYEELISIQAKNAFCLLSSTAIGVGMNIVAKWEIVDEGVNWRNFAKPPPVTLSGSAPKDNHSLAHVCMMLIIDAVLYQVLAWYIEKVCPGTLGLPQPFYFPFQYSYWFPRSDPTSMEEPLAETWGSATPQGASAEQTDNDQIECWEAPASTASNPAVKIKKLTKIFKGGKQALGGVTLELYEGTIVGLLGHNGAGKSTTMSILTGLFPPTSGDVLVHGLSVRKDSIGVRRQLGVCLQHNALYGNFTVEEHLRLFCCLKAVPWPRIQEEVDTLLQDTGLLPKRHVKTLALSGGMKRKLSIAIALAGGSKVVTLDEPTAGVDATSRRDIWHLLVKHKWNRTILLSTHLMDEADILSDRIAIIAEGKITAIGSSLSLKRHFAKGYLLTVYAADGVDVARLSSVVFNAVPTSTFVGARGRELCYALPFSARYHFPILFEILQDPKQRLNLKVETYGLSAPSMEEVFLAASSVHEKGLNGVVRNASAGALGDDQSDSGTASVGGQSGISERQVFLGRPVNSASAEAVPVGKGVVVAAISAEGRPDAAGPEVLGATPSVFGLPITARIKYKKPDATQAEKVERPQSPQCMDEPMGDGALCSADEVDGAAVSPAASDASSHHVKLKGLDDERMLVDGHILASQQFVALIKKRALSVGRDRRAWASQIVLPSLFVLLALVIARILQVQSDLPPLRLSTDMYIGTTDSGPTSTSVASHIMPIFDGVGDSLSGKVQSALQKGKGGYDVWEPLSGNTTMGSFLLQQGNLRQNCYGAVSMNGDTAGARNLTLWFKNQALHAIPAMVSLWNNARFKLLGMPDIEMEVWSHPLPKNQAMLQAEMTGGQQVFSDLTVAITVILAMGFVPASFLVFLVHEKASNGKHQQLLSGVSSSMYWITCYCWDVMNYMIPLLLCFILFAAFKVEAYSGSNLGAMFMLLLCYGFSMTPLMYCLEPIFMNSATAYVTMICVNIFTGTLSTLAIAVLELYQDEIPDLKDLLLFGKAAFPWLLPNYCLGRGMMQIALNYYLNFANEQFGVCIHPKGQCWVDPLSYDVSGKLVLSLCVMAPVWFLLRLLIEWGFFLRGLRKRISDATRDTVSDPTAPQISDEAVLLEEKRIASCQAGTSSDKLIIERLEKSFVKRPWNCGRAVTFRAVRDISVGVPAGECFGLLGVNGAGKTTTMRMITGDTEVTAGDVRVAGTSIQGNRDQARRRLGYCPQFDALPDKLTVRETLFLYAKIRGVPRSKLTETVDSMVSKMCLEAHGSKLTEHLSGGNKRKLSTALALIGEPDVVLLDEPSTGVDVGARRFFWDVIGNIRQSGHAVVLTSHSMEECEVLCTRLTVMVHGKFRCLGSPLQLKAKYGGGYSITVKALPEKQGDGQVDDDNCARIRRFMSEKVSSAELTEASVGLLRYRLGHSNGFREEELQLADIFRAFEDASREGGILEGCVSDYSVSQTSLEEVFLHFSREAEKIEAGEFIQTSAQSSSANQVAARQPQIVAKVQTVQDEVYEDSEVLQPPISNSGHQVWSNNAAVETVKDEEGVTVPLRNHGAEVGQARPSEEPESMIVEPETVEI